MTQRMWKHTLREVVAKEISWFSRYYDRLIQYRPLESDSGELLERLDCGAKSVARTLRELPDSSTERRQRTLVLLNGNLNHELDIYGLLAQLKQRVGRFTRILIVTYNPYVRHLYGLANALGLRRGELPTTFVTLTDLNNIARLAGYEVTRIRPVGFAPFEQLPGARPLNRVLPAVPLIRAASLVSIVLLRPVVVERRRPSVTVVIPARNERGNIATAVERIPDLGAPTEVIFVEGGSIDGTWAEIQRVLDSYQGPLALRAYQQTGTGKSDAVRLGFSRATGELLAILDADLTVPPELLPRFYQAYLDGVADFINGSRLVYPMEDEAMRFLNRAGNVFFAKLLSGVLDTRLGDTLCGTKLIARHDYERLVRWRRDFGDFDPFGDFELLFAAAALGIGLVDVAIPYQARRYGSTNIFRFRHGAQLLKMAAVGLTRVKMGH